MVMSAIINKEGTVCIAHDAYLDARPVGVVFKPETKSLTLELEDGSHERIGSASPLELIRRLHHSNSIKLTQLAHVEEARYMDLPLYIKLED